MSKSAIFLSGALAVFSQGAVAQVVDCNISQRSWGGLVTEWYSFDIDADRGRVVVSDPTIRFVSQKPVKSDVIALTDDAIHVAWDVKKLPSPLGDEQRGGRFEAELDRVENRIKVTARYSDDTDGGTGKGICFPK